MFCVWMDWRILPIYIQNIYTNIIHHTSFVPLVSPKITCVDCWKWHANCKAWEFARRDSCGMHHFSRDFLKCNSALAVQWNMSFWVSKRPNWQQQHFLSTDRVAFLHHRFGCLFWYILNPSLNQIKLQLTYLLIAETCQYWWRLFFPGNLRAYNRKPYQIG